MFKNNIKAIVLFSGGLDSILAIKVLQEQGIEVLALTFESNFFNAKKARENVGQLGVKLKVVDVKDGMIEITKNPSFGYGKNMNPCIDCHANMIKIAGQIAEEKGYDFVATGEVLGQRPMSQNREALRQVAKLAGVPVLRPLSAKLLEETEIEKEGLVNREKLLDIHGRSREKQEELIRRYKIKKYPSPAGGCLLTDPSFADRLREMYKYWPDCKTQDIELLKYGRIFWFNNILVVIGRKKDDNEMLAKLAQKGDFMVELKEEKGQLVLVRGLKSSKLFNDVLTVKVPTELNICGKIENNEILQKVAIMTGYYRPALRNKEVKIKINKINTE